MTVTIIKKPASDLTAKQRQGAYLLACGSSKKACAATLKVAAHTISAWCKLPAFQALVKQITEHLEAESYQAIRSQKLKAIEVLSELLEASTPPATRLQAVRVALELPTNAPTESAASSYDEFMQHFGKGLSHASYSKPQHQH